MLKLILILTFIYISTAYLPKWIAINTWLYKFINVVLINLVNISHPFSCWCRILLKIDSLPLILDRTFNLTVSFSIQLIKASQRKKIELLTLLVNFFRLSGDNYITGILHVIPLWWWEKNIPYSSNGGELWW